MYLVVAEPPPPPPPVVCFLFHFANNVVSPVIVSVAKMNFFVNSASLYQPAKVYPVLVGSVGFAIVEPSDTFSILATVLPPFLN